MLTSSIKVKLMPFVIKQLSSQFDLCLPEWPKVLCEVNFLFQHAHSLEQKRSYLSRGWKSFGCNVFSQRR